MQLFVEKYDKKEIKHQSPANNFFSTLAPFSLEYLLVKRKRLMTNERDPFPFCEDYGLALRNSTFELCLILKIMSCYLVIFFCASNKHVGVLLNDAFSQQWCVYI